MEVAHQPPAPRRKFLGIYFKCCSIYGRIYQNTRKDAYEGACPRCGRRVHVPIGTQGSSSRFFVAE